MFKKYGEFKQEPKMISEEDIANDLLISDCDPLYSDAVKKLIADSKPTNIDEILKSESFQKMEQILQMREDLLLEKKSLSEKLNNLEELNSELEEAHDSINSSVVKACNKSQNLNVISFNRVCDTSL